MSHVAVKLHSSVNTQVTQAQRNGTDTLIAEVLSRAKLPNSSKESLWDFRIGQKFRCSAETPRFRVVRPEGPRGIFLKIKPGDNDTSVEGILVVPQHLDPKQVFDRLKACTEGAPTPQAGEDGAELMAKAHPDAKLKSEPKEEPKEEPKKEPVLPPPPTIAETLDTTAQQLQDARHKILALKELALSRQKLEADRKALDLKLEENKSQRKNLVAGFQTDPLYQILAIFEEVKAEA